MHRTLSSPNKSNPRPTGPNARAVMDALYIVKHRASMCVPDLTHFIDHAAGVEILKLGARDAPRAPGKVFQRTGMVDIQM